MNMQDLKPIIELNKVSVKTGGTTILNEITLSIRAGEKWAIVGNSGSGKTTFAHALAGKIFYTGTINFNAGKLHNQQAIILVEQQHKFKNLSNTSEFYYQQRFNSSDAENAITVKEALDNFAAIDSSAEELNHWIEVLHLSSLLQKPLIQLSNGENKRLQLAEALLSHPAILILDNPFIGLDIGGRKTLHSIIDTIATKDIHTIIITTPQEVPETITYVGVLEDAGLTKYTKADYQEYLKKAAVKKSEFSLNREQLQKINTPAYPHFSCAIEMKNVSVQYGDKKILDHINWQVKKGECWNVSGPNGAGKSTLLSLITADNPQAYANEIYLFDNRRGKGESIWDIKRKIGYVSPELHLFFEQHNNCFEVIASGLFDTIGLFRQISEEQEQQVNLWIELFQLQKLKYRPLFQLSLGQQRLVLLARALVKNPPLLILDEPSQGMDEEQTDYFKNCIDQLCRHFGTTLLYVSHYAKDIPSCVTKYLKLENGREVK